ncbi:DUF1345 domain-containing protein [Mucilaginibacter antarcticus]|uniref:DUF1345 domain-containing protein n=1 Tax=Mucilaginibacter antarcticus TaxID=1855725 RepID=A0ABW5XR66_9SPHI
MTNVSSKTPKLPQNAFFKFDAHYRVYIALGLALVAFFLTRTKFSWPETSLISWITFAFTIVVMDWIIILNAHPKQIRKIAKLEDSSRTLIFLFVIFAALISLSAILFLLKATKGKADDVVLGHVLLAMASVVVSWWLVHTLFTMRYAHLFYTADEGQSTPIGGLEFPGDEEPDYLDFVYFSFVVGMTFQVSDVEISSRHIRRLTLIHGVVSFVFNTAIVALSINVVSSLM